MQKYDAIEKGIANNDIKALREAIGSICYTSRDFSSGEFDEIIQYVESHGIKIKDETLVGNPTVSSQKSDFTDQDFAKAIFELKKNFCDERIEDVKRIGKKLYSSKTISSNTNEICDKTMVNGTNPNYQSHQQKNAVLPVMIVLVAVIAIILVVLLVKK